MGSQPPPSSSDGSAAHRLSPPCVPTTLVASKLADDSLEAFSPVWSPASHELAFSDHAMNGESDLFVMQANAWA